MPNSQHKTSNETQVIFHIRSLRVRLRQVAHQIFQQGSPFEQGAVVRILLFVFDNMEARTAAPGEEAFDSVSALSLWRTCETNVRAQRSVCCRLRAIDNASSGVEAKRYA